MDADVIYVYTGPVGALENMPRLTSLEISSEGMDPDSKLGPEGAASLAPALEKMTQLTSLDLGCAQTRFWARPRGVWVGLCLWCVLLGTRLDAVWCGWGYALAGGRCGRRIARCVLEGRAAMDAGNGIGPEGAASLAPALEKMQQLTSLYLGGARIRFWARARGVGGSFSLVRAVVGYALGWDVVVVGVCA
jgi:hypothetical protein